MWPGDVFLERHQSLVYLGLDRVVLRRDPGDSHAPLHALLRGRRVQLYEHRQLLVYHAALRCHLALASSRREVLLRGHQAVTH